MSSSTARSTTRPSFACELEAAGHRFATDHSDTEVLVHGFEQWGDALFPRLNGMFALALWDRDARRLTLARDRAGEKPLYVARLPRGFAVASELKALAHVAGVDRGIDPVALEQYLALNYVVAPRTIFCGVSKLPAGHVGAIEEGRYEAAPYWVPPLGDVDGDASRLVERFDGLLDAAVERQMIADVPVGVFLSGGLDSTTVAYYMRRHSDEVHSFSVGFESAEFDESPYSTLAARNLGTVHHHEVLSEARLLELVPRIPDVLDEPMGDASIIPTYFLSAFTRPHVKVALGGDGSDELLMGYRGYDALRRLRRFDALPSAVRGGAAAVGRAIPRHVGGLPRRVAHFAERLDRGDVPRLLSHLGSYDGDARWLLAPAVREQLPPTVFDEPAAAMLSGAHASRAEHAGLLAYVRGYLQEDILVKVDRASMAASLEVRAPFLDVHVLEFLLRLSPAHKVANGTTKLLLRRLMRGRIPDEMIDRDKRGFDVPMGEWMRGPLRPLLDRYLGDDRLRAAGLLDPPAVRRVVDDHLSGRAERGLQLWMLLQLELWRERWAA